MMREKTSRWIFGLVFLTLFTPGFANGYRIKLEIHGQKGGKLFLGHHHGQDNIIVDSLYLGNNGKGEFKSTNKLAPGLYFIIFPSKDYIEFLLDTEQQIYIESNKRDLNKNLKVHGSFETELYHRYKQYNQSLFEKSRQLQQQINELDNRDSALDSLENQILAIDKQVLAYKKMLIDEYPGTFTAKVLSMTLPMNPPVLDNKQLVNYAQYKDYLLEAYNHKREHFFDHIDFSDARLLNTPFLYLKLDHYFTHLLPGHPDSVIMHLETLLDASKANQDMYKYVLGYTLKHFVNNQERGMDKIIVHLAEEHYLEVNSTIKDPKLKAILTNEVKQLQYCVVGKEARDLKLYTPMYDSIWLHEINSKYTVLYFWDVDCYSCTKEIKKLKELYDMLVVNGLEVLAVYTGNNRDDWLNFIIDNRLDWINAFDPDNESRFGYYYFLKKTPAIYLLDEEKYILMKDFKPSALENLIN